MNTKEFDCPCIDCITKVICKIKLREHNMIVHLKTNCSLLKDYLNYKTTNNQESYNVTLSRYRITWSTLK